MHPAFHLHFEHPFGYKARASGGRSGLSLAKANMFLDAGRFISVAGRFLEPPLADALAGRFMLGGSFFSFFSSASASFALKLAATASTFGFGLSGSGTFKGGVASGNCFKLF